MANHVLDLVCASTIHLGYDGSHTLRQYVPAADEPDEQGHVTESAVIMFKGATGAAAHTAMQAVDKMLRIDAPNWDQYRAGTPVYVQYDPNNSGTIYRSPIVAGKVVPSQDTFGWQWNNNLCEAQVTWTRRPYWEGPEATLASGSAVYNTAVGSTVNYVNIAGAAVLGSLPAAVRLEMKNGEGTTNYTEAMWCGLNKSYNPTTLTLVFEGEDASGKTGTADATCSGGKYEEVTLGATEADLLSWALSYPHQYGGGYYRAFLRLQSAAPASTRVRLFLTRSGVTLWQQGALMTLDTTDRLQDLGTVQIPPILGGVADIGSFWLKLRGLGSGTLNVDYLALIPMEGYRAYTAVANLDGLDYLVDDGIAEELYVTNSSLEDASADFDGTGQRPMLAPGIDQRLHFLMRKSDGTATVARHAHITVKYRPRRATL